MASYKSLYRVFRPRTFDDVVGQEHITDILKKQVGASKASHAYLFCGPRGTGKTSTAKILANALNCTNPQNGNPCGQCEVCKSFLEDSFVDIVEIDAASNNGVDNVRDIRDKVSLLPANGKYKVYIIDEVHMLSIGAFNALLKTLEEPPPHAVFILATTEQRKVPATILSRCQKYDFRRITDEDIVARMQFVAKETGTKYTEEALALIAQQAEGAMRDALSIMDQCIAASEELTVDSVAETMGVAPSAALERLTDSILTEDPAAAVQLLNQMLYEGISPHNLLRDLISALSKKLAESVNDSYARANALRSLEALIAVQANLRYASVPAAVLLAAVVRATVNTVDLDTKDMELRLKKLEKRVEQLAQGGMPRATASSAPAPPLFAEKPKAAPAHKRLQEEDRPPWEEAPAPRVEMPVAPKEEAQEATPPKKTGPLIPPPSKEGELAKKLEMLKAAILQKNMVLYPAVNAVERVELQGNRLVMYAPPEDAPLVEMLADESNRKDVQEVMAEVFGQEMMMNFVYSGQQQEQEAGDLQMELVALFGEENVGIVEE